MTAKHLANPKLRQLRANPLVWGAAFLVFSGPLNSAAWLVWAVTGGATMSDGFALLAWTVLLPSTVVAMVVLGAIWRRKLFSVSNLWYSALIGLGFGILTGSLSVVILSNLDGVGSMIDMMNLYFILLFFGTMYPIIPFFAVVFGLPCMFATVPVGYLCSEPVD